MASLIDATKNKITEDALFACVVTETPDRVFGYPNVFPPFKLLLDVTPELKTLHADFQDSPDDPVTIRNTVTGIVQVLVTLLEELNDAVACKKYLKTVDSDGSLWFKIGSLLMATLQAMTSDVPYVTALGYDTDEFASRAVFLGQDLSTLRASGYDLSKADGGISSDSFTGLPKTPIFDYQNYYEVLHTGEGRSPAYGYERLPIESKILLEFGGGWTRGMSGSRSFLNVNSTLETDEMHEHSIRRKAFERYTATWSPRRKAAVWWDISKLSWFEEFAANERELRNGPVHKAMLKTKTDLIKHICEYIMSRAPSTGISSFAKLDKHTQTPRLKTAAELDKSEPDKFETTAAELDKSEPAKQQRRPMSLGEYLNIKEAAPASAPVLETPTARNTDAAEECSSPDDITDQSVVEPLVISFLDMTDHSVLTSAHMTDHSVLATKTQDEHKSEDFSNYVQRLSVRSSDMFAELSPVNDESKDAPVTDTQTTEPTPTTDAYAQSTDAQDAQPADAQTTEPTPAMDEVGSYGYSYDGRAHHYMSFQGFDDDNQRYVEFSGFQASPHESSNERHPEDQPDDSEGHGFGGHDEDDFDEDGSDGHGFGGHDKNGDDSEGSIDDSGSR